MLRRRRVRPSRSDDGQAVDTAPQNSEPIRILVVEDQPLIRRAFAAMLGLEPDIEVVGQAADGAEGIELVRRYRPDVVLMDIQMPRVGGIAATRRILAEFPATQIVVLSTFDTDDLVFEAISAGAHAYLLKDASEAEILATIRGVQRGESRLSPNIARKVMDELRRSRATGGDDEAALPGEPLTGREEGILALVAKGRSNREISEALSLAEGTVKNYVSRVMEKLGASSRTELAVMATRRGRRPPS
jgi:DNA-binding NarL/FixJ family response regulator